MADRYRGWLGKPLAATRQASAGGPRPECVTRITARGGHNAGSGAAAEREYSFPVPER